MTQQTNIDIHALADRAIAALPAETYMTDIDRGDALTDRQIALVLGGKADDVRNELFEQFIDDDGAVDMYLHDALPDVQDRHRLREDHTQYRRFADACRQADASSPFNDLLHNTPRRVIRFMIRQVALPRGSWDWAPARVKCEAKKLAKAAKIDFATNEHAFIEMVENATYGGWLCVPGYVDVQKLAAAVEHLVQDHQRHHRGKTQDRARVKLTFTDPYLLVYDGCNGSGHDAKVTGQIVIRFGFKDLNPSEGVLQVDHRDAGTGYSWSDEIAGVVCSAYQIDPTIETR